MTADDTQTLHCLRRFLDEVHLARPDDLPEVAARAAADLGWTLRLYVVDHEQSCLVPLPAPSVPDAAPVAIDGTLAGRAFRRVEQVPAPGAEPSVWVPLLDGVHRLGVLQYGLPAGTDLDDPVVQDRLRLLSHLVGHLVVAKSPYGDAFDLAARRRHRTVPTELLHGLLPPLTFGCPGLLVSGILEPCYDVAADAFDYSVVDGVAHLAVFDAMGHDLRAARSSPRWRSPRTATAGARGSRSRRSCSASTTRSPTSGSSGRSRRASWRSSTWRPGGCGTSTRATPRRCSCGAARW